MVYLQISVIGLMLVIFPALFGLLELLVLTKPGQSVFQWVFERMGVDTDG